MRTTFLTLAIATVILRADGRDFTRLSTFESVEAFVAAAKAFQPATAKTNLSALFATAEPVDPKPGTSIFATFIDTSTVLWSNDSHALVFTTANPPTGLPSAVGVLFLLKCTKKTWRITDRRKFTACGLYAGVTAELTADAGRGYQLGRDGLYPVVTVTESWGGRGWSYKMSASYTFGARARAASTLERLEL